MTVGQLAGIDLQGDYIGSGAVFDLRNLSPATGKIKIEDWTISVRGGSKSVVAHAEIESDIDQIFPTALSKVNLGLDYLCATGAFDGMLDCPYNDSLTWSLTGSQITMRSTSIHPGQFDMSAVVTVLDADGNAIPQPAPAPPRLHDALRFIRMARSGDALFDTYRNMFLALEAVLHHLHPQQKSVRESNWFKAALAQADRFVPVSGLVPAGEPDPIQWAYDNIYASMRSGLMHAKRNYHLPGDEASRPLVERSLNALWQYTSSLMNHIWGTRFKSGGFFEYGWKQAASHLEAFQLRATNDPTALPPEGGRFASPNSEVVILTPGPISYPQDYLGVVDGECDGEALRKLRHVTRIGATDENGETMFATFFEPGLVLGDSVKTFQFRAGWRYANPASFRSHFPR